MRLKKRLRALRRKQGISPRPRTIAELEQAKRAKQRQGIIHRAAAVGRAPRTHKWWARPAQETQQHRLELMWHQYHWRPAPAVEGQELEEQAS